MNNDKQGYTYILVYIIIDVTYNWCLSRSTQAVTATQAEPFSRGSGVFCCLFVSRRLLSLSQRPTLNFLGITSYLVGKVKFKLFFHGPLAE